ncbi:LIM domain only protein 7 isoform X5 [Chironomus tepperi]|uniref:LIM domain only protein 7 isoform X5 n=1 Tax=Chironomus tepperi TaxID=113505 RepID=UPI00391FB5F7
MPSPSDMETNSQYSSCETLDSYRSSECDEKNEVNGNSRGRKISAEHTDYIVKERVTRKEPPKPAYNPMQFVQIKPSNLCQSAQEQLKKAEEIKKVKEVTRKEDPEDWQNNLDNWKSSRRKRVEHIIDRVVEVKKLEEEEHDRNRRSIKTFSELMEERGSRRKLSSLAIYTEDDSKFDMSDLTPVVSDVNDSSDKMETNSDNHSDKNQPNDTKATDDAFNNNNNDGSSKSNFHSTALIKDIIHKNPIVHPEVAKEEKIEIEQRMTTDLTTNVYTMSVTAKQQTTTTTTTSAVKTNRSLDSRERDYTYDNAIEDYKSRVAKTAVKLDLPKVNITKRRELFEKEQQQQQQQESKEETNNVNGNISTAAAKLGTEIVSIKDRISSLRSNLATSTVTTTPTKKLEVPVQTKLKDRLSSLHQQISSPVDEPKRIFDTPFKNIAEARNEFEMKQHVQHQQSNNNMNMNNLQLSVKSADDNESLESTDREDSGIHTTDISCSVSQADEQQPTERIEEFQRVIQEKFTKLNVSEKLKQQPDVIEHVNMSELHDDKNTDIEDDDDDEEDINDGNDDESSDDRIEEALDMAFELIDSENVDSMPNRQLSMNKGNDNNNNNHIGESIMEPIYQNVVDDEMTKKENIKKNSIMEEIEMEPHYQVPRSREPYYESPKKTVPIPLYENVELMFPASSDSSRFSMAESNESFGIDDGTEMIFPIDQSKYLNQMPPKEKPPPPPIPMQTEDMSGHDCQEQIDNFKRINSTKRIKKEIRNKRSSFLGIDGQEFDDENTLKMSVAPPPNIKSIFQEEKRLEKQMYQKVGLYENAVNGESRDSGLDNHSRQGSEPSSESSTSEGHGENTEEVDGSGILLSERRGNFTSYTVNGDDNRIKSLEEQISQQETYSNYCHHQHDDSFDDDHQEFNAATWNSNSNMSDLEYHQSLYNSSASQSSAFHYGNMATTSSRSEMHLHAPKPYQAPASSSSSSSDQQQQQQHLHRNSLNNISNNSSNSSSNNNSNSNNNIYGNMTRHALMQISAVPKPKLTNDWVQYRKSEPAKPSLNSHWLIQEAEQRRIEQLNNVRSNAGSCSSKKPLPESIIQTITQRVVDLGIGTNVNKRYTVFDSKQMPQITQAPSHAPPLLMMSQQQQQQQQQQQPTTNISPMPNSGQIIMHNPLQQQQHHHQQITPQSPQVPMLPQLDVLSVSSKKICSYCNRELGSGAAMIIENLGLFYHIDCFKCTVCQTQIADGNIHGTDVRVRNSRLHCANCFSNEEGIKFSCV